MLRIVRPFEIAWSWVEKLVLGLIILFTTVLVLVTTYQVFSRYVLNHPLTWSEELSRYLFVWIVFLGAWAALKEGRHLGMDMLSGLLAVNWRRRVGLFVDAVVLVFLLAVLMIAPEILEITGRQRSAVLKVPMSFVYLAFPAAAALMAVEILLGWISPARRSPGAVHLEKSEREVLAEAGVAAASSEGQNNGEGIR